MERHCSRRASHGRFGSTASVKQADARSLLCSEGRLPGQGMSEELLQDINREATRRMTALVAPQASEAHGPAVLRLSMGPLFEEVSPHMQAPVPEAHWLFIPRM